jgi:hypothetical protein
MKIDSIIIDSTNTCSKLCELGALHNTDKSPYNSNPALHKHPYTAIYNLLFNQYRNAYIVFVELGIEWNASMKVWDNYFDNAIIYGFEYYQEKIDFALQDNLNKVRYKLIDVTSDESIHKGFRDLAAPPTIVIDDSTHNFDDQVKIIRTVLPYIASTGMLIIEDIFRDENELRYSEVLSEMKDYISYATFITANHKLEHTPDWDNSKLLVIYKK